MIQSQQLCAVLIVVTDGTADDDVGPAAAKASRAEVISVAVGIGANMSSNAELRTIAGATGTVITVDDFNMESVVSDVQAASARCSGKHSPPGPYMHSPPAPCIYSPRSLPPHAFTAPSPIHTITGPPTPARLLVHRGLHASEACVARQPAITRSHGVPRC